MTQPEIQLKRVHEKILLLLKRHQTLFERERTTKRRHQEDAGKG